MTKMDTRSILLGYSVGTTSRGLAMRALGIEWYGDLLLLLNQHQIPRPQVSAEDALLMDEVLTRVLG